MRALEDNEHLSSGRELPPLRIRARHVTLDHELGRAWLGDQQERQVRGIQPTFSGGHKRRPTVVVDDPPDLHEVIHREVVRDEHRTILDSVPPLDPVPPSSACRDRAHRPLRRSRP